MKNCMIVLLALVLVLLSGCSEQQGSTELAGVQQERVFSKPVTRELRAGYLLFLPEDYNKTQEKWPMIMYLHGAGERGDNIEQVKSYGPAKMVETQKDFPFVVVSPQCPMGIGWDTEVLINLLDEVVSKYNVDKNRIYLTGLSMGGGGTWKLATQNPDRFAAITPICGWGEPDLAYKLKDVPTWVFHGEDDSVVSIEESIKMVRALEKVGGDVKLTVYPDTGHESWKQAYADPNLYQWFLEHRLKN